MPEKYKLGLSRNRLFEFNSTVVFCGKFKTEINRSEVQKAVKMLSCKETVITAKVMLESDSDAYIVTEAVNPQACFSELSAEEIISDYDKNPLCFYNRLFEFTVSYDGCLIIAGHTVFCDSKSLLRLASDFAGFYDKSALSVEADEIYTFSQPKSLPVDVLSPLINKLSSELDNDWQKNAVSYGIDDYNDAREAFLQNKPEIGVLRFFAEEGNVCAIRENICSSVDFSSVVCFAFYKAIIDNFSYDKKSSKMRISADRRFFHGGNKNYSVGAYNGNVSVSLTKKERKKDLNEQLRLFHTDAYKAITSPYRVFADETLLNNVQNNYCDSAYIFAAGKNKFKASQNLAENYSCMKKELCEFLYYNLTQKFWDKLVFFDDVFVKEPFNAYRSAFSVTFAENRGKSVCELRYDSRAVSKAKAEEILKTAQNIISNFKN